MDGSQNGELVISLVMLFLLTAIPVQGIIWIGLVRERQKLKRMLRDAITRQYMGAWRERR